jgi:hypothetical protein
MQHDSHAANAMCLMPHAVSDTCSKDSCVLPPPETSKKKLLPYDADSDERSAKRTKFRDNVEDVSTGKHPATHITHGAIVGKVRERGREKSVEELGTDKTSEEEQEPVSLCRSSRKGTTEYMLLRIEYKGPCDGLGRPLVVDGLARGAPKGGKNPKRPSERVNFENAFLPASHRTTIEALALRVLPRTSQALARINPKIENKEEIEESAPALISLDTRLNKPAGFGMHVQREHNPSHGASKWGEGTCLEHLTNWCCNSDKCERGIHPKIRVFVNNRHQDPRTLELTQPQTVLHMSHAVPEWERILQSAKDANGNTLLKRILDPSPTTSPTLAPTRAAPAPPPRMCRKQCAQRSPTPPLARTPQDFNFRHPTPPLPHTQTQMCVVKTEISNKSTQKRGGGSWTSVTPLPVNFQTIVAALLGAIFFLSLFCCCCFCTQFTRPSLSTVRVRESCSVIVMCLFFFLLFLGRVGRESERFRD